MSACGSQRQAIKMVSFVDWDKCVPATVDPNEVGTFVFPEGKVGRFVKETQDGVDFGPGHWNAQGHKLVAEELKKFIRNQI